jgi:hypothetical protein
MIQILFLACWQLRVVKLKTFLFLKNSFLFIIVLYCTSFELQLLVIPLITLNHKHTIIAISLLYFHGSYFHSISNRLHQFEHNHHSNEWNQSRKFVGVMFFSKVSFAPLTLLPETITFDLPLKLGYKFQLSSVVDDNCLLF